MEGTELLLGDEHLASCLALSKSAGWNQNEADWRLMLEIGHGLGIALADRTLAATTVVLPYGSFAWVSMVLVLPEHRGKGYATRLLRLAITDLKKRGQTPILDATPAGHEVYVQEGFRNTWGFRRYSLAAVSNAFRAEEEIRPVNDSDWPQILQLDAAAFGAGREPVLRNLAARLPQAALVAEHNGALAGFLFGRDGREARQLGPLVARNGKTAKALLGAALARIDAPLYLDITDRAGALQSWGKEQGLKFQRPFTRMVHGAGKSAPGDAALVYCPAGPELG